MFVRGNEYVPFFFNEQLQIIMVRYMFIKYEFVVVDMSMVEELVTRPKPPENPIKPFCGVKIWFCYFCNLYFFVHSK